LASALAHGALGWRAMRRGLEQTTAGPELVADLATGWLFGRRQWRRLSPLTIPDVRGRVTFPHIPSDPSFCQSAKRLPARGPDVCAPRRLVRIWFQAVLMLFLCSASGAAQTLLYDRGEKPMIADAAPHPQQVPEHEPVAPVGSWTRWVDVYQAALRTRYRYLETSEGLTLANQLQTAMSLTADVKVDPQGRYRLQTFTSTGDTFTSGWSTTGIGTGDPEFRVFVKRFYFTARPVDALEAQVGGLDIVRGESTEATTYDNDGYLTGERLIVRHPKLFFVDLIAVTRAYLGDLFSPNVFPRLQHLDRANYYQVLVQRRLGARAAFSTDYTNHSESDTFRAAVSVRTAETRVADHVRLEVYRRLPPNGDAGFTLIGDRQLGSRIRLTGGYGSIDEGVGALNGDQFGVGRHIIASVNVSLGRAFSAAGVLTQAVANSVPTRTGTRVVVGLTWDVDAWFRARGRSGGAGLQLLRAGAPGL
jgi:hypothetical protein